MIHAPSAAMVPATVPVRSVPRPIPELGVSVDRPGGTAVRLFSPQPRLMATPSRHAAHVDLSDDGCPSWGSNLCMLSTRGSAVYWERVATVREIEVLCTELLDKDPYLVGRWQTLWADSHKS